MARYRLASRPRPLYEAGGLSGVEDALPATVGDVKAQNVRLADVLVFGPMMIYAGLGKKTPNWIKIGMVVIGVGTIVYNLVNYFEVENRKRAAGVVPTGTGIENETLPGLAGMDWGPMHKMDPRFHRPIMLGRRVAK